MANGWRLVAWVGWAVALVVLRGLYLAYTLWCLVFALALVALPLALLALLGVALFGSPATLPGLWHAFVAGGGMVGLAGFAVFAAAVQARVLRQRTAGDPNPFQSACMAWFGTLRWFWNTRPSPKNPVHLPSGYLVENPGGYLMGASASRAVMALVQPGVILLRGYRGYLDGALIRRSALCTPQGFKPGWFTHAALYMGALTPEDQASVPAEYAKDAAFFEPGVQMVVHAMAQGVHAEDVLTFCRCDYLAILRMPPELTCTPGGPLSASLDAKLTTPKHTSPSDQLSLALDSLLLRGTPVARASAIEAARLSALEKIGTAYDFDCSDSTRYNRFSCAELVFHCLRGVHSALALRLQMHGFYPLGAWARFWVLMKRNTVTPDDFYDLVHLGKLECIWQAPVTQAFQERQT